MIARIEGNGGTVIVEVEAVRSNVDCAIDGTVTVILEKRDAEMVKRLQSKGAVAVNDFTVTVRGLDVEVFASRAAMKRIKTERQVRYNTSPESEAYWCS